ncbi:MAG: hypothetical protein K8J31_31675 [Anaerolineae bacterium]|nr:hypothetical protein [Anaerolineae bacterium]
MQNIDTRDRFRLALLIVFALLGVLTILAWAVTGQRAQFEVPTLFFGATSMVLLFGFF